MNNLKQLIKEFRTLRSLSSRGTWLVDIVGEITTESGDVAEMLSYKHGAHDAQFIIHSANNITKLLDAMEVLVEAVEFYAEGAGLILEREQMFSDDYIAYENDFRRDTPLHLEKPVGEYARKALQLAEEKVSGEHD